MDKKIQKKIDTLHERLQRLRQQLSGAKKQIDDPADVSRIEQEIKTAEAELAKLKS